MRPHRRAFAFTCGFIALLAVSAMPAQAYIGPGLGAGTIAAILGIFGSIGLALFAVVYYPIKRALKRRKKAAAAIPSADAAIAADEEKK